MARGQMKARFRNEIHARIMRAGQGLMHRRHDRFIGLRPGHGENTRVNLQDFLRIAAHAAGDDDPAVFGKRLADGLQGFRPRRIQKAAGVDDHEISAGIIANDVIAFRFQARDDALRIHQRLRTAQRDDAHLRNVFWGSCLFCHVAHGPCAFTCMAICGG